MSYFNTDQDNDLFIIIIILQLVYGRMFCLNHISCLKNKSCGNRCLLNGEKHNKEYKNSDISWFFETEVKIFLQVLVEYLQNKTDESDTLM